MMQINIVRYLALLTHNVLFTLILIKGINYLHINNSEVPTFNAITLNVTVTAYRPLAKFTDKSPNWTSIGTPAIMGVCAVSQDLLVSHSLNYGDIIEVTDLGVYKVMDTMNIRHTDWIDILVYTHQQEKIVGKRKNVRIRRLN